MPQTLNITNPDQREQALTLYVTAGRFADAIVGQVEQRTEQLRSVAAKIRAATPANGQILRAIIAGEQEEFEALAAEVSPVLQAILDFATTDVDAIREDLDGLAKHPVVTDVLPALIVREPEPIER